MDPRNYGMYGQSSPRNVSWNGGCTGCGFQQGACQGFSRCTVCGVQQGACQGFNKDVKDFKVAQAVEFSKVQCLGTACSGQGCVKECHVFQVKDRRVKVQVRY